MRTVLITGGAGYVGSHCCKAFANAGWNVVVYDDLSRGWRRAVRWGSLIEGSLLDRTALVTTLRALQPDLVAHLAAFAYVGESVEQPGLYYRNNSMGTLNLLDAMRDTNTHALLFSSTCATYGLPAQLPITEDHPQSPINPYGWSKLIVERMLEDYCRAHGIRSVALRYFNAAGSDPDGELGEHHDPETHAIPLALRAALRPENPFSVFGTDFATPDGSAIRDYTHVTDLARAHLLAGEHLLDKAGCHAFNLGTGIGTSVLEVLSAVERVVGKAPSVRLESRRVGDPPALVASFAKAQRNLGWVPELSSIDTIVSTALPWQERLIR